MEKSKSVRKRSMMAIVLLVLSFVLISLHFVRVAPYNVLQELDAEHSDRARRISYHDFRPKPSEPLEEQPEEKATPPTAAASGNTTPNPKTPVRIVIPAINLDSRITAMGVDSTGALAVPSGPHGISWYRRSAYPGYRTNAIMAGHNVWNNTPGTFADLHKLSISDSAEIHYYDKTVGTFEVQSNTTYLLEDIPDSIMSFSGTTRTTLITCAGKRTSSGFDSRLIVILQAVELPD